MRFLLCFIVFGFGNLVAFGQNVGINSTGAAPNTKAMLDIASTTSGLLIPRMTTVQRDAITTPPVGLYIYNTTTNRFDVFNGTQWVTLEYTNSNEIVVRSLADLPAPSGGAITLDPTKSYKLSGVVNISPNYINLNGAAIHGVSPLSDVLISNVAGAVLRSTDKAVHVQQMSVVPASGSTQAFNFSDATGTHTCAVLTGSAVRDIVTPSLGVGQVSGFRDVIFLNNLWDTRNGVKLTGNVGGIIFAYNIIHGISAGSAVEFLSGLTAVDVDISNNQFTYTGQTGITLNVGATIDFGRMTSNNFRGVTTVTSGFDSYTPGWQMLLNPGVPDSRSYAYAYMHSNATATTFSAINVFTKILGTTTLVTGQKFTSTNNRFTYIGKRNITTRVFVVIGAKAPAVNSDYTIAIAKNGTVLTAPTSSLGALTNNQGFQIVLETEISLTTNDYLEVFIRNNASTTSLAVSDLQFRVSE